MLLKKALGSIKEDRYVRAFEEVSILKIGIPSQVMIESKTIPFNAKKDSRA
jgi:hypothetical protein